MNMYQLTALPMVQTWNVKSSGDTCVEARSRARKMFLLADNDAAIRRALLRKSNPHTGNFETGQDVMYWRKKLHSWPP
jgi:hypothetical protein